MASSDIPLRPDQIDLEKITIRKPTANNKTGAKKYGEILNIQYNNGPLRIMLPEMVMPFGAKLSELNNKIRAGVTFDESKPESKKLRDFFKRFEDRIQRAILEVGPNMYPKDKAYKKTPPENIKQRFKGIIKSGTDDEGNPYPERIDLILPRFKNDPNKFQPIKGKPFIVDKKDKEIPTTVDTIGEILPRGTRIRGVIEAAYVFAKEVSPFETTIAFNLVHAMRTASQDKPSWSLKADDDSESEESGDADSTTATRGDTSATAEDVEYEEQEATDSENESADEESPASA